MSGSLHLDPQADLSEELTKDCLTALFDRFNSWIIQLHAFLLHCPNWFPSPGWFFDLSCWPSPAETDSTTPHFLVYMSSIYRREMADILTLSTGASFIVKGPISEYGAWHRWSTQRSNDQRHLQAQDWYEDLEASDAKDRKTCSPPCLRKIDIKKAL